MEIKNIFSQEVTNEVLGRINKLTPETKAVWGKMTVDQVLAHCTVPYEMVYNPSKFKRPGGFGRFMIKLFAKKMVVGVKPYPKNGRTAPDFVISGKREFETEKQKLIGFINKTTELGEGHFDGKESHALGKLSKTEWNVMFYKHLNHHLTQFGV